MTDPHTRHLVVWEARHDNGWTTLVMEQSDGTFVAWAGPEESVGVDYVEDSPEHAQAAAMFALKRRAAMRVLDSMLGLRAADAHDVGGAASVAVPDLATS